MWPNNAINSDSQKRRFALPLAAGYGERSGGHAAHVRQNAALTSFAAWFGNALRAAEPGCFTCHGGHRAFGLPSPAQVSAAFGFIHMAFEDTFRLSSHAVITNDANAVLLLKATYGALSFLYVHYA